MAESDFLILPERAEDHQTIEQLLDAAFGLGRRTKTAYRLREGSAPIADLCFTARLDARLVGSIQFWPLIVGGETEALLLGPLAVAPELHGQGCGLALMKHSLARARELGHRLVILVGDAPYYARVGFERIPDGRMLMPGPVDPDRFLALELQPGALAEAHGLILGDRERRRAAKPSRVARGRGVP
jgi:predicted N-acetyltransferase YhbS